MQKRIVIGVFFMGLFGCVQAQEVENIGTETVTVIKPYSPTISDAFKVRSTPNLNDSIVLQKKEIEYHIFSVPVASTFTPAKGKAANVEKTPPPTLFNSYASVGLGNFNNALVDFYTSRSFNRGEDLLDVGFNHHSSRGTIDGTALDNIFYNTKLNASYAKKDRDYDWGVNLGLQHQLYNWYGIPDGAFDEATITSIDERQNYYKAQLGAHINMEDSFFKSGEILLRRFWDAVESGENRIVLSPTIELPLTEELVTINTKLDYVGGTFKNASLNNTTNIGEIDYGYFQVSVNPSLLILRDDLTLNLGANFVYGMNIENSDSDFYIYPAVTASYRLLDDNVIAYGGIEGELKQNSYYSFVEENPYVSPTLTIMPTDQQYEGYIGLKGQLFSNVSYNIKGSYMAENRKSLFKLNPTNLFRNDEKGYYYGNSFEVFYDDVKTLGIFGELNVDVNRNFSLGTNVEVYDYDTETDNPAWNLPSLKASLFMDYQIGKQWYMGANLFFVDQRDDVSSQAVQNIIPANFPAALVSLDSYFDANAHIGYRFNEQLSVFAKAANIANNNYNRWSNYPVQGFQILGGVTYKFDF
ncbi:MAG: TonB-dependent receptor [Flavobacteriaceae bacterium]|nr:MAG: TonB-dependent receptor [Flavobacteriaceae bacterium]